MRKELTLNGYSYIHHYELAELENLINKTWYNINIANIPQSVSAETFYFKVQVSGMHF